MNKFLSTLTGFAAGMAAMYFLDERSGRQRRTVLRDQTVSRARKAVHRGQQEARHLANRVRGVVATGHLDRSSRKPPHDDHQLHERIRADLGHVVSHPGAIHVQVVQGEVTLTGNILRHEIERLLDCVRRIPGVQRLDNQITEHEQAGSIPDLQGRGHLRAETAPAGQPPMQAQSPSRPERRPLDQRPTAWH